MILHDHVTKTISMLKDDRSLDDVLDVDDEDAEDEDQTNEGKIKIKKKTSKDIIEASRQALLKTRAMSTQNLDPESVSSATMISDVVDGWLVNMYKSEYTKVSDVVKGAVVKHLNRRREMLHVEIVPRALEKAADVMKEHFEKDCRKPLEDLKLAFNQTEEEVVSPRSASNSTSPENSSAVRDRTETVIELDLNSTMIHNDEFNGGGGGGSNSVILNENDFKDEETKSTTTKKHSFVIDSSSSSSNNTSTSKKEELVVTSNGVILNTDQKSETPIRQADTWHPGQKEARPSLSKMTYAETLSSEKPKKRRLRRSMSVPSQPMDRDEAEMILMNTPPKRRLRSVNEEEPSPASKMVEEQISQVKNIDDVRRTLNMSNGVRSTSSNNKNSSRKRTTTAPIPAPVIVQVPKSSGRVSRSRESTASDIDPDVHRCESEVTSLIDKNLKDFTLTSLTGSGMKTESRSRQTSNVSTSSFASDLRSGKDS